MPVFSNTDELHEIMTRLWARIASEKQMSEQLLSSRLVVQFHYRDPEGRITVDCSDGKELKVHAGESSLKPVVEMFMKADIAHDFWLGKVNVPLAIIGGKIVSKGPVNKALSLLPVIKPAFDIYPGIFNETAHRKAAVS